MTITIPTTASSRTRKRRILPVALVSAGLALGALAGPAVAYADRSQNMADYDECVAQPGADAEVCCALHNGKWISDVPTYQWCSFYESFQPVAPGLRRVPDNLSNAPAETVTTVPTKA